LSPSVTSPGAVEDEGHGPSEFQTVEAGVSGIEETSINAWGTLLHRERIERRPDAARHLERRRGEQELPDPIPRAVSGERFQVEHLAERESHVPDAEQVERKRYGRVLPRDHLHGDRVGRYRSDLP